MRLLVYAPALAAYGGLERHVCGLAEALAREGHAVAFLTPGNSLAGETRAAMTAAGVRLVELAAARGATGRARRLLWLWLQARALRREPWDVVYTNGQSALASVAWRAAGPATRVVHHHHTAGDASEQASWNRGFRDVLRRAPVLVGCSAFTRDELARATGRRDVRFLPYLAPDPLEGAPAEAAGTREAGPARFGFVGRLVATKGIDRVLALAARPDLADVRWEIHGEGPDFPPERFLGLPTLTFKGGFAGAAELRRRLAGLDALVLPSRHNEGMPLSLIEAMAAGLPFVATDRGGTRELVGETGGAEIVAAEATDDVLAAAVRRLADRIGAGACPRPDRRAEYLRRFAPPVVLDAWRGLFAGHW